MAHEEAAVISILAILDTTRKDNVIRCLGFDAACLSVVSKRFMERFSPSTVRQACLSRPALGLHCLDLGVCNACAVYRRFGDLVRAPTWKILKNSEESGSLYLNHHSNDKSLLVALNTRTSEETLRLEISGHVRVVENVEGTLFAFTTNSQGQLCAWNAITHAVVWQVNIGEPVQHLLCSEDNMVICVTNTSILAFLAKSGLPQFRNDNVLSPGPSSANAIVRGTWLEDVACSRGTAFVGCIALEDYTMSGHPAVLQDAGSQILHIVAVSLQTGNVIWKQYLYEYHSLRLKYSKESGVLLAAAACEGGDPDGELVVWHALTGARLFHHKFDYVISTLCISGDLVAFATDETNINTTEEEELAGYNVIVRTATAELFRSRSGGYVTDVSLLRSDLVCWVTHTGVVNLWDVRSGMEVLRIELGSGGFWSIVLHSNC